MSKVKFEKCSTAMLERLLKSKIISIEDKDRERINEILKKRLKKNAE